jgi:hypothetical protein
MSMSDPRGRFTVAIVLIALLSACLTLMGVASGARALRRHVEVHVYNLNDYAQVFVDCRQAVAVRRTGDEATIDLGWLDPDALITLQARNGTGDSSWGFTVKVNGRQVLTDADGRVGALPARVDGALRTEQVTHKHTITAAGHDVGDIGCQDAVPAMSEARRTSDAMFDATGEWLTASTWLSDRLRWLLVGVGLLGLAWLYLMERNGRTFWGLPLLAGWYLLSQQRFGLMFVAYGLGGALLLMYVAVSLLGWRVTLQRVPPATPGSPHL